MDETAPQTLAILGAGYTGLRLAEREVEAGTRVWGTTRTPERAERLEALGAEAIEWDLLEDGPGALAGRLDASTTVVYSIPTLRRQLDTGEHIAPVEGLLEVMAERGIDAWIYLSSISVYGDQGGEWVDEQTPRAPNAPTGRMRRDLEELTESYAGAFPVSVARIAGIYGPGRTIVDYLESGRYRLVGGGEKITNRIHVEDLAATISALARHRHDEPYVVNVADGHPVRVRELVDEVCERLELERPPEESLESYAERRGPSAVARWTNSMRVRNRRMREELGVELRYPDVFSGYRAILGEAFEER
jgi:nucleoside-diphosphate-sugar epimerase